VITNYALATLNAILNATALTCVVLGALAIARKQIQRHKRLMLTAFTLSLLFLASYVTRILMFGDQHFRGTGALRYVYFAILISHVTLALGIAPFVVYTVSLGLRDRREQHNRFARKVLPIWIYVLATGVIVYLFLYQYRAMPALD
jgi:putative membrane protein